MFWFVSANLCFAKAKLVLKSQTLSKMVSFSRLFFESVFSMIFVCVFVILIIETSASWQFPLPHFGGKKCSAPATFDSSETNLCALCSNVWKSQRKSERTMFQRVREFQRRRAKMQPWSTLWKFQRRLERNLVTAVCEFQRNSKPWWSNVWKFRR